jgi:hypothetical protein
MNIGKLTRVPLRSIWPHEERYFSRWLQDNLEHLNELLGLDLQTVGREAPAGDFFCDLVAEDGAGSLVVIENQLERSDHGHLGKVITYVVALNARAAIWIVADPRPEHVAAIAWLNENNAAACYMVKLEAVKIGESAPAPLFTLIVGPSVEAQGAGATKRDLSDRHIRRHGWWTELLKRAKTVSTLHARTGPGSFTSIGTGAGIPGLSFNYVVKARECWAELYIARGQELENKEIYDALLAQRGDIESRFGGLLDWQRLDHRSASRICYRNQNGGLDSPEADWPMLHADMAGAMKRLEAALRPTFASLPLAARAVADLG